MFGAVLHLLGVSRPPIRWQLGDYAERKAIYTRAQKTSYALMESEKFFQTIGLTLNQRTDVFSTCVHG